MGYPERLLSDGEVIEAQFRPHWSGIIREGIIILIGVVAAAAVAFFNWPVWLYAVIVGVVLILIVRGMTRWLTTLHVITNERLIYRSGFIAKQGTEIPLEVIQNVAFNQTLFERIFGTAGSKFVKDGFHRRLIEGAKDAVNPANRGTKAAAWYEWQIPAGESVELRLRLFAEAERPAETFGAGFDQTFATRSQEADAFFLTRNPKTTNIVIWQVHARPSIKRNVPR